MAKKSTKESGSALVTTSRIERQIYTVRGQRVMLDADLAGAVWSDDKEA